MPARREAFVHFQGLSMAQAIPGPDRQMKLSDDYVRMVARDVFFWAWPIVNVYHRRLRGAGFAQPMLLGGVLPAGPNNTLTMLTDYIDPAQRAVACPNQDVVYGNAVLALDRSPVVLQLPDFGERFWVCQAVDSRTDSFAELGTMYGSRPGFYLLVGPNWAGTVPAGIERVFVAQTHSAVVIPRVFRDDTPADLEAVRALLQGIALYPVAEFDGRVRHTDWQALPKVFAPPGGRAESAGETPWVPPEKFLALLPAALADAPPLAGEAARYAQALAVAEVAANDARLRQVFEEALVAADAELVAPLFEFRHYGRQLPHHWSTIANGANFGTDYFTRTAVAKSNIFVNRAGETQYFYQDLDAGGERLTGERGYSVRFEAGELPPVKGFWSLTLYDAHHFFAPNPLRRHAIGTRSRSLRFAADGSLTIHVQAASPGAEAEDNWLPAPAAGAFSLYIRAYWPEAAALDGRWTPPPVVRRA